MEDEKDQIIQMIFDKATNDQLRNYFLSPDERFNTDLIEDTMWECEVDELKTILQKLGD